MVLEEWWGQVWFWQGQTHMLSCDLTTGSDGFTMERPQLTTWTVRKSHEHCEAFPSTTGQLCTKKAWSSLFWTSVFLRPNLQISSTHVDTGCVPLYNSMSWGCRPWVCLGHVLHVDLGIMESYRELRKKSELKFTITFIFPPLKWKETSREKCQFF